MPDYNDHSVQQLTWGILYHLIGCVEKSRNALRELQSESDVIIKLRSALLSAMEDGLTSETRRKRLLAIAIAACDIIDNDPKKLEGLGYESPRPSSKRTGEAEDDPKAGISRDPFKSVDEKINGAIALAAALYLLRGHCMYFCRPRDKRSFNAAKMSLNDLHQAYHLTWRLYQSLATSHHEWKHRSLEAYWGDSVRLPQRREKAADSPYFVWSLFLLCEIFRGNLYRNIEFLEEAERYYRRAIERYIAVATIHSLEEPDQSIPSRSSIISPTLIKGAFELFKVEFDLGRFLESLRGQVMCIRFLLLRSLDTQQNEDVIRTINDLNKIEEFLDAERTLPVFDRDRVTSLFGDPWAQVEKWPVPLIEECLDPRRLALVLHPGSAQLAVEILARIGFTLYTIRPRLVSRNKWRPEEIKLDVDANNKRAAWLRHYFRFDLLWNSTRSEQIQPSNLGLYGQTSIEKVVIDANAFADQLDRRYALYLRQSVVDGSHEGRELSEKQFYQALLRTTTQNIGNLITIPRRNRNVLMRHGYLDRRSTTDLCTNTVKAGLMAALEHTHIPTRKSTALPGKLVVLRRFQSYNPIIPRPARRHVRGGGYFLVWHGKGIVIDPGYDFIQNFYDEGFSLDDVHAIVITHSHPDHDNDFASLTTLVTEWNEYHAHTGQMARKKQLDIFLNESTHWKFAAWLQAAKVEIGRVVPLPVLCWNKDSKTSVGPIRGHNIMIDLRSPHDPDTTPNDDSYEMQLEVVPAWHDDVIGKTSAVGLKFHLFSGDKEVGSVGFTGDTGAYGLSALPRQLVADHTALRIDEQYSDCKVLVAHLGDVRLRELGTVMHRDSDDHGIAHSPSPAFQLLQLLRDTFRRFDFPLERPEHWPETRAQMKAKIAEFLKFAVTLDLIPSVTFDAAVECRDGKKRPIKEWLAEYFANQMGWSELGPPMAGGEVLVTPLTEIAAKLGVTQTLLRELLTHLDAAKIEAKRFDREEIQLEQLAYLYLELLVVSAFIPWQYPFHLGVHGIYRLFESMVKHRTSSRHSPDLPVFVIGELPEELTSYRHAVAHLLNMAEINHKHPFAGSDRKLVQCMTGDIGLHIQLLVDKDKVCPRVRCTYCNYNNELVTKGLHYHRPEAILETPIKRLGGRMIYLCTTFDHHPEDTLRPRHFLGNPILRVI